MEISKLPFEILCEIAKELDRKSLKVLRLVSRQISTAATKILFSEVIVIPRDASVSHVADIMTSDSLKSIPRSLVLSFACLHCYLRDCDCGCDCPSLNPPVELLKCVMKLSLAQQFDRLHTLVIQSPPWIYDVPFRECALNLQAVIYEVCTFLSIRRTRKALRPIRRLKIVGLLLGLEGEQMLLEQYKKSIREVVGLLQQLHIMADLAILPDQPLLNSYYVLENVWLSNLFPCLTSLFLGFSTDWGAIPLFETNNLRFPVLENLSLHNYTLLYRSQFAWILSISTLKSLILEKCPIPWVIKIDPEEIDEQFTPAMEWITLYDHKSNDSGRGFERIRYVYENPIRWSEISAQIADELPNLEYLAITGIDTAALLLDLSIRVLDELELHKLEPHELEPLLLDIGLDLRSAENLVLQMDFAINLYTMFSNDEFEDNSRREELGSSPWIRSMITRRGPLWTDYELALYLSRSTFKRIGGIEITDSFCLGEVFTKDFAALAKLFDTIQARASTKKGYMSP